MLAKKILYSLLIPFLVLSLVACTSAPDEAKNNVGKGKNYKRR